MNLLAFKAYFQNPKRDFNLPVALSIGIEGPLLVLVVSSSGKGAGSGCVSRRSGEGLAAAPRDVPDTSATEADRPAGRQTIATKRLRPDTWSAPIRLIA